MAFEMGVFVLRIVVSRLSSSMTRDVILDALQQALYARQPGDDGTLIHHPDRVSIRQQSVERVVWPKRVSGPSVGARGDSYDNALTKTVNGLYKMELIARRGGWKARESVNWRRWDGLPDATTVD